MAQAGLKAYASALLQPQVRNYIVSHGCEVGCGQKSLTSIPYADLLVPFEA